MVNIKILQINVDRRKNATDLMVQKANELEIDVCLVQEPTISITKDWPGHEDAKISIINRSLFINRKGQGLRHSWIDTNGIRLLSCYISPNSGLEEMKNIMDSISQTIREKGEREALISGDFNAKSWAWGSNIQDRRGAIMMECIKEENLFIQNMGYTPTFTTFGLV